MCVDYRDFIKASPKDDFPLPHIDMLVDVEKYIFGKYFNIVSIEIGCYYHRSIIQIVISSKCNQVVLFEKLSFE